MRVSSGMIFDAGVASINRQTSSLLHLQQQISSNRRILAPSDDPVAAARALEVTQASDIVAQFKQGQNYASSALGLEEVLLGSAGDVLARVRELTVQAGNTSLTASDRKAISTELRARFDEMLGIANASDGMGNHIFAGFMSAARPFGGTVENILALAPATSTGGLDVSSGIDVTVGVDDTLSISLDTATAVNLTLTDQPSGAALVSDINAKIAASPALKGKVLASLNDDNELVLTTVGTDGMGAHKSLSVAGTTLLGFPITTARGAGSEIDYQGDDGQRKLQISPTRFLEISDSGNSVFKGIRNGNGYFVTNYADGNTGTGVIDTGTITDPAKWNAATPKDFRIEFSVDSASVPPITYYDIVDPSSGNSMLTGARPTLPPTAASGQRVYQSGQPIVLKAQVPPGVFDFGASLLISGSPADGDSFSVSPSSSQSVFATMANLIGALEAPAGTPAATAKLGSEIGFALNNLDQGTDNILRIRSQIGSRMNEIESLASMNEDLGLQYQQTLSDLQDLDYAKAISDLTRRQTDLQAAQQSFVKISQLSLFNYL